MLPGTFSEGTIAQRVVRKLVELIILGSCACWEVQIEERRVLEGVCGENGAYSEEEPSGPG